MGMKIRTPVPEGPYAVGTVTFTVENDREETLKPGTMRSIPVRLYYPVRKEDTEGFEKARYVSERMAKGLPVNYKKLEKAGENFTECFKAAPPVPGEKFPPIVFSHGYGSYREGCSFLCVELASRGYAVLSVGHPMEASCTELDDGTVIPYDRSLTMKMYQPFVRGVLAVLKLTRAEGSPEELCEKFYEFQDRYCRFMAGRAEEWVKDSQAAVRYAKEAFSDRIDFSKGIGATGHSFGGATAYLLCLEDPEFVCGANIDGALFGFHRGRVQEKPFLQISCKDNEKVVCRAFVKHTEPAYRALFRDMKHVAFSDAKFQIKMAAAVGKLPADEMHENLCACHLQFFDTYLKGLWETPGFKDADAVMYRTFEPDA